MIEITITTKAGKFLMKGEELLDRYAMWLRKTNPHMPLTVVSLLGDFLKTYEEEVKTEESPSTEFVDVELEDALKTADL